LLVFYIVTVQALNNTSRIRTFLAWWTLMFLVVAGLAVASEYGFDPTRSSDVTHGAMKHRLILNTSIFNNPNALGHSVFPVVFLLYFLCFWKRPVFMKIATIPMMLLPLYCVYLTASKGAYIAAFITVIAALSFGRPKVVQILILVVALTIGWTALWALPRMGELEKTQTNQAIQGRVAAFGFGLDVLKRDVNGLGKGNFTRVLHATRKLYKSAHSSYVAIGAELGLPGFCLFIGILYTSLRTLWQAQTRNFEEERVRRILFAMLVAYTISSWMVDFAYRGSLFLLVGAIAAFHRLMLAQEKPTTPQPQEAELRQLVPAPAGGGTLQLVPVVPGGLDVLAQRGALALPATTPLTTEVEAVEEPTPAGLRWNRIRWVDLALIGLCTWLAIRFWVFIMNSV
jgi:O-antigen ligase